MMYNKRSFLQTVNTRNRQFKKAKKVLDKQKAVW